MIVVNDTDAPALIERNLQFARSELEQIYYSHQGRRIFKWHHYLEIYDRHLRSHRAKASNRDGSEPLRVLEIGVQNGGSLQMWRRYFGSNAVIFGIDNNPLCKGFEEDGCQIRIGDQSDPVFLSKVISEMSGVDIVIDDGSHIASHQLASFRCLFPLLSSHGTYFCEDLHTSYWDGWEGGLLRSGTFIEQIKSIIDEIHGWYHSGSSSFSEMQLKEQITGMHIYDSVAVFDKGIKSAPYAVHVGHDSFAQSETSVDNIVGNSSLNFGGSASSVATAPDDSDIRRTISELQSEVISYKSRAELAEKLFSEFVVSNKERRSFISRVLSRLGR